jgi:hypothetical protein
MLTSRLSNFVGDLRRNEVELGNLFRFRYFASKTQKSKTKSRELDKASMMMKTFFFRSKKSLKRFQNYIEHNQTREN